MATAGSDKSYSHAILFPSMPDPSHATLGKTLRLVFTSGSEKCLLKREWQDNRWWSCNFSDLRDSNLVTGHDIARFRHP